MGEALKGLFGKPSFERAHPYVFSRLSRQPRRWVLCLVLGLPTLFACNKLNVDPDKRCLPPGVGESFAAATDPLPVFQNSVHMMLKVHCAQCHGDNGPQPMFAQSNVSVAYTLAKTRELPKLGTSTIPAFAREAYLYQQAANSHCPNNGGLNCLTNDTAGKDQFLQSIQAWIDIELSASGKPSTDEDTLFLPECPKRAVDSGFDSEPASMLIVEDREEY